MLDKISALLRKKLSKSLTTGSNHSPALPIAPTTSNKAADPELRANATGLLAALGGQSNVLKLRAVAHTRVRVELRDRSRFDAGAASQSGARASTEVRPGTFHLIVGDEAEQLAQLMS